MYIYIYVYIYICIYIYMCVCAYVFVCVCICNKYLSCKLLKQNKIRGFCKQAMCKYHSARRCLVRCL